MIEFPEYLIDELQNWEFRIEDVILHTFSGVLAALILKIKMVIAKFKKLIKKK